MRNTFLLDYLKTLPIAVAGVLGSLLGVYGLEQYGVELTALEKFFLAVSFLNLSWLVINALARRIVSRSLPSPTDNN